MNVTTVHNLSTDEYQTYIDLPPWQAVRNAYALSTGDANTWEYDKYNHLIRIGGRGYTVSCGDWCALLQPSTI